MPAHISSSNLTLGTIPSPDAEALEIIRFSSTFNGYTVAGMEGVKAIAARLKVDGFRDFSLDELRVALFARQRAHYHQGGAWPGQPDSLMDEMRELVAEIRQRVLSGEHQLVESAGPMIRVWMGDITTLQAHAIVNAANETLLGGGGVDGAIHRVAGPELVAACRELPELIPGVRCPTGQARITPGFQLAADHVIHAVGPRWAGGTRGEDNALAAVYRSILGLADAHQLGTVAIPAISTGIYGFPPDRGARIAVATIRAWKEPEWPYYVTLVGFDEAATQTLREACAE